MKDVNNTWTRTSPSSFTDELVFSMSSSSILSESGHQEPMDCLRANENCNQDQKCSQRFRIMRQCLAGKDRNTMLANKDCQVAMEVLQEMALFDCRCKRGMKKEMQCLQSYWSINIGMTEGRSSLGLWMYGCMHRCTSYIAEKRRVKEQQWGPGLVVTLFMAYSLRVDLN